MIIITRSLTVIKIFTLRIVIISAFICLLSYLILKHTTELSPSVNTIISFFLSVLTSIVFELSLFRAKLIDNEIIGEIFSDFAKGNETELNKFYNSFRNRFSKHYRTLNLAGEINPIKDLSFLFRVYKITSKENCGNTNFQELIKSYNEIKIRKTIYENFGLDFSSIYTTLAINALYTKYYIKQIEIGNLKIDKALINKDLEIIFDFGTKLTNKISDDNVESFVKNTENLKNLISYVNLINKDERLLPIIKEYLQLKNNIEENRNYYILKEHIILQLSNCFHFANEFQNCKDETKNNLINIITPYGFESVESLIEYCQKFHFNNELVYFLNSIDSENHDNLLNIIYDKIGLLKNSYPNIINIAILNKLAYSIGKSFDFFFKCYEDYKEIYQRQVSSNANYIESIILYDSFSLLSGKSNELGSA